MTEQERKAKVVEVAKLFCRILFREILGMAGDKTRAKIVALNRLEKDPNICHTHDFCDANMVMLEACDRAGIPRLETGTGIWNEAWSLAKKAEFDEKLIEG